MAQESGCLDSRPGLAARPLHLLMQTHSLPGQHAPPWPNERCGYYKLQETSSSKAHPLPMCEKYYMFHNTERPVIEKNDEVERQREWGSERREWVVLSTRRLQNSFQISWYNLEGQRQQTAKANKRLNTSAHIFPREVTRWSSCDMVWDSRDSRDAGYGHRSRNKKDPKWVLHEKQWCKFWGERGKLFRGINTLRECSCRVGINYSMDT